ncbi:MAG: bifunctional alpha,alpha-trehalose-phosphate synthase (UDP-forming)/trehalose-phosphatase [Saprospiraceae bacterium]|nr:bifunctional alpha,alpha-trehalose-phosphate synthase (UDP-forming)/trehalose-phosphatase [Saprospiraceae bacterium]
MSRIIIVSNRLPVTVNKSKGELVFYPSAGGLATGLNSLDEQWDKIWVGWPGEEIKDQEQQEKVKESLLKDQLYPVFLSKREIKLFYEGFSNKTIWPHFHYFTQYTTYDETSWKAYRTVNEKFAHALRSVIEPGDLIWVHDYQLMLLPAMIRKDFPSVSIGFFLHIPFPSYEVFRILPWRKELLLGVLGADQIGFHTFGYMRHFLSAVYRIGGFEHQFGKLRLKDRIINVDVFPMGIDYDKYANPTFDLFKGDGAFEVKRLAKGKKLIISIDRLDYTKGIPQRILAFEQFLERNKAYRERVSLVLIVVPSRANVDQYQELKQQVDTLVGAVNGRFGTFNWEPIKYFYRALSPEELMSLYQEGDIAMITPLRDGMNLVAKEYIASKDKSKKGVLILSEMAGASNELTEALIVNPQDIQDLVHTMQVAINMNEKEQRWRLERMQEKLRIYTVKHWATTFVKEQQKLMEIQPQHHINLLQGPTRSNLLQAYWQSKRALIILDYDGTLMNFDPDPQAVFPDEELINLLEKLATVPQHTLVVNSGRDKTTLGNWLGRLGIDLAAEHGVWVKKGPEWYRNEGLKTAWKTKIRQVLQNVVERTPGSFIEEKDFSLAWHYRRIDRDLGEKRVREFRDVLLYLTANLDLQVLEGNKVVEIKNAGVNKGKASLNWLNEGPYDFILAIGDDHTDEDIFAVLPIDAFSIKVGLEQTKARFNLTSVEEVRGLLAEMVNQSENQVLS